MRMTTPGETMKNRIQNKDGALWFVERNEVDGWTGGFATTYQDHSQVAIGRQLSEEQKSRGWNFFQGWLRNTSTGKTRLKVWSPDGD
jgi:hypothetical protein